MTQIWRIQLLVETDDEAEVEREAEIIRPLKDAMRAAGIKLSVCSYEGVWGSYQIGDGPEVDFDQDSLEID